MDWMHVYIATAAFSVFALVALVLFVSSQQVKFANTWAGPYLKFIWANFIKPHDKKAGDQQDALESFYKTQVRLVLAGDCDCDW
jgi:betaine lipid synthase